MALSSSIAADDSVASSDVARTARTLVGVFAKEDVAEMKSRKDRDRSLGFIGNLQAVRLSGLRRDVMSGVALGRKGIFFMGMDAFEFWAMLKR
jgi:hypothetical protein